MLTAYDYTQAKLFDEAGVDSILVGDSLAMVVQGHQTTLPVTPDEMLYHAELVGRAVEHALVVVDIPFPINHLGKHRAIEFAGSILKRSNCQAVKLEGGQDQADVIAGLVAAGIPVMAHVGLQPQSVHVMGGYKVAREQARLLADAKAAEHAGAFGIVLECMESQIANEITESIDIPTIGIGAGKGCDGQVLVGHDMLGLTVGRVPKFVKQYTNLGEQIQASVKQYCDEVRGGEFPGEEHGFAPKP